MIYRALLYEKTAPLHTRSNNQNEQAKIKAASPPSFAPFYYLAFINFLASAKALAHSYRKPVLIIEDLKSGWCVFFLCHPSMLGEAFSLLVHTSNRHELDLRKVKSRTARQLSTGAFSVLTFKYFTLTYGVPPPPPRSFFTPHRQQADTSRGGVLPSPCVFVLPFVTSKTKGVLYRYVGKSTIPQNKKKITDMWSLRLVWTFYFGFPGQNRNCTVIVSPTPNRTDENCGLAPCVWQN